MGNLFVENQTHYEFFTTADGSPSVCLWSDRFRPEAMHHRQGALAESLFVYHGLLEEGLSMNMAPQILSVGLGCGYNEMIAVAHFLSQKKSFETFYLESFEGDSLLRESFLEWMLQRPDISSQNEVGDEHGSSVKKQLHLTFEKVALLISSHFRLAPNDTIKNQLRCLYDEKQFILRDWLTDQTQFQNRFGIIFFDAFSSQSSPELWNEDFLTALLEKAAQTPCGLATYAATGTLNRALKKSGFVLREQKGFSGKRQSTRAFRIFPTNTIPLRP